MVLFFYFFWTFFAFSQQAEELPIIKVQEHMDIIQQPRSVEWPVINTKISEILNMPQVEDGLQSLNGVQIRTQGSPTYSIRGSAQSSRTLVLYNDIPLNFGADLGAPGLLLPKEGIGNVQVIKGPASLFYGSQAMSGTLNFQPKVYTKPQLTTTFSDTNESSIKGKGLSHNNWQLASPIHQTANTHIQTSIFTENDDGAFPYNSQSGEGVRSFNAQNTNRFVLTGNTKGNNYTIHFDAIAGRQIRQLPGPLNYPILTREHSEALLASLTPSFYIGNKHLFRSRVSFLNLESQYLETGLNTLNNQSTWINQNEWVTDFNSNTSLQFFADYFAHKLDNSLVGQNLKQDRFETGTLINFFSLANLKHQVGGRYVSLANKFLPTLSSKVYFGPHESWISYSEGFRSPSLTDLFSQSPFFVGNRNLQPESSKQWELGFIKKGLPISVDFRIFHIQYENFIEAFEATPGVYSKQNQGKGYSQGLDLELRHTTPKLQSYFRYNFLEAKNENTGRVFRLSPKHQVSVGTLYQVNSWLKVEIQNTQWYKAYDIVNNSPVPLNNWSQWNFLFYAQATKELNIRFGLINAFNEGKELTLYYPEPQRKYWLQLTYVFL